MKNMKKKEKTFEDYVKNYSNFLYEKIRIIFSLTPTNWESMFKFGLLQYIADDLKDENLNWEIKSQKKVELYYDHDEEIIKSKSSSINHTVGAIFTQESAEKAKKIIPSEFLKSFGDENW